ncbi:MAG: signal peptidase I [Candidatus Cohnella colombiensis]|uniref:Signal peptidase I n=1 Tax=Candidatus Cohnella colombiensis TaxID=3121368 RepID=A0AA95JHP9_9BACL|nr:MAG: signal peptidase I [Cohnella sp.]
MEQRNGNRDGSNDVRSQADAEEAVRDSQSTHANVDNSESKLDDSMSKVQSDLQGDKNSVKATRASKEIVEWIKALAIAGLLVFIIRWLLVSPFIVEGASMQPNFWDRERIIVNKVIYDIRAPKRGEVIVFHVPEEGRDFIKRVIGLPGDSIEVKGDTVLINGEPLDETYLAEAFEEAHANGELYNQDNKFYSNFPNGTFEDGVVPEGMLFVLGDNRSYSEDSRMIGYIPQDRIVGRADLVFWPLKDFHFISKN